MVPHKCLLPQSPQGEGSKNIASSESQGRQCSPFTACDACSHPGSLTTFTLQNTNSIPTFNASVPPALTPTSTCDLQSKAPDLFTSCLPRMVSTTALLSEAHSGNCFTLTPQLTSPLHHYPALPAHSARGFPPWRKQTLFLPASPASL